MTNHKTRKIQELEHNIYALFNTERANINSERDEDTLTICFNFGKVPLEDLLDYIREQGFEYKVLIALATSKQRKDKHRTDNVITINIW